MRHDITLHPLPGVLSHLTRLRWRRINQAFVISVASRVELPSLRALSGSSRVNITHSSRADTVSEKAVNPAGITFCRQDLLDLSTLALTSLTDFSSACPPSSRDTGNPHTLDIVLERF